MIIEVKNGYYTYHNEKEPTLKDISFRLEDNQIMTILGKNGIGKTTLLKCMSGIYKWDSGETLINGLPYKSKKDIKSIAFVPQAHPLSYPYTVRDTVIMGRVKYMGALSIPNKKDKELAEYMLEVVGMQDYLDRAVTQLSGGQLQMVFIARALASEPELLVMDEPESHLDFKNQYKVIDLVENLKREHNISSIINTHYPDHALRISDRVLMLGADSYEYGSADKVITEENIAKYFGVDTEISRVDRDGKSYESFIVFGVTDKNNK